MRLFWGFCLVLTLATPGVAKEYKIPAAKRDLVEDENLVAVQQISRGVATIAKKADKAIVFLSVFKSIKGAPFGMIDPFDFFFGPGSPRPQQPSPEKRDGGLGSGFFVDLDKGYILTNNHVVQGADEIHLKLANGETYQGKIVGRDKNTDIAVVQIKDESFKRKGLATLSFENSSKLQVGDFVLALGAPYGLEASLSFGIVSALGRGNLDITRLGNFIQTDAAINPGNSGGPLLNMSGHVVGMNTAIYSRTGGYNGIGFAVPANLVATVAEQLINHGYVQRGYLGVWLQPLDDELAKGLELSDDITGAVVSKVAPDSPAARSGLEPGDVIASIDGDSVRDNDQIVTLIGLMKPGTEIRLAVYREGKRKAVTVTVGAHPEDKENGKQVEKTESDQSLPFGLTLSNTTSPLRKQYNLESDYGTVVINIEKGSAGERAGLKIGDLILKVDGNKIESKNQFANLTEGKNRLLVWIERAGDYYFVTLRTKS